MMETKYLYEAPSLEIVLLKPEKSMLQNSTILRNRAGGEDADVIDGEW